MKKIKFLFPVAILLVFVFIFQSSTSEEKSNNELIADLYSDLAKMDSELSILKSESEMNAVGNDPFLGEISMFGGNFAPRGWALCDGQLLPISQNTALFSILGTTFGGDGRTTFGLPDLRGRSPMHAGTGPGLSPRRLGEKGGVEQVALTIAQIPAHNHGLSNVAVAGQITFKTDDGTSTGNTPTVTGVFKGGGTKNFPGVTSDLTANGSTNNNGGSQTHTNVQPYQVINYIIALQGTYPSRS